jgi:hypothetical protein
MFRMILAIALLAAAAPAQAESAVQRASCIDTSRDYLARPLNDHEIYVQSMIGKPRPPIRLKTSCHNLHPAIGIGLRTQFTCIGLGDTVVATLNGGEQESCVVTGVLPYAPNTGDLHG